MKEHYNIEISESVTSFTEGLNLLVNEIRKLHTWERQLYIDELIARGFNGADIARMLHISRQAVSRFAPKNSLKKATGSPLQADGGSRHACNPPVARELKSNKGKEK